MIDPNEAAYLLLTQIAPEGVDVVRHASGAKLDGRPLLVFRVTNASSGIAGSSYHGLATLDLNLTVVGEGVEPKRIIKALVPRLFAFNDPFHPDGTVTDAAGRELVASELEERSMFLEIGAATLAPGKTVQQWDGMYTLQVVQQ